MRSCLNWVWVEEWYLFILSRTEWLNFKQHMGGALKVATTLIYQSVHFQKTSQFEISIKYLMYTIVCEPLHYAMHWHESLTWGQKVVVNFVLKYFFAKLSFMQKVVFFPKFFTNFSVLGYLSMAFVSVRFEILFWQARVVRRFAPPSVGDSLPSIIYIYVLPHFSFYSQESMTGEKKMTLEFLWLKLLF